MVTITLTAIAIGTGLIGVVVVLRSSRAGSHGLTAIGRGLIATGAAAAAGLLVVSLVALATDHLRAFGIIHLLYLVGTVSVPMVGVAGATVIWSRRPGITTVALVVLLLVSAPVGFYATHVEPLWLRVDHVDVAVDGARAGDDPVKIGVLADLQTNSVGSHEREAVDRLVAAAPDVIVIPGDLFHGSDAEYARELDAMRGLLGRLDAPHGVYFTQGDADPEVWVARMFEGTEIQVLDRDVVDVEIGDRRLRIGGHTLHPSAHDAAVVRAELQGTVDDGAITVLVAHRPDTVLYLPERSRVDLTIAGHTHGGQIVVPGIGPLVTLSEVPREVARGGLHEVDGNQIYVSPGVGIERGDAPQVRLFNRPAVAILTLR